MCWIDTFCIDFKHFSGHFWNTRVAYIAYTPDDKGARSSNLPVGECTQIKCIRLHIVNSCSFYEDILYYSPDKIYLYFVSTHMF